MMMATYRDGRTTLYLVRHGATAENLARPACLQGRKDTPLAEVGVRQAQAARDVLTAGPLHHCYTSPLCRAFRTAEIIAEPHGIRPTCVEALTECDVGRWEGLDWETIRGQDPQDFDRFHADPGNYPYPGGESFGQVYRRAAPAIDALLRRHAGQALLVVAHHVVNRTYLAGLLGLSPGEAKRVTLDNCGISVVIHDCEGTQVRTLNANFHLRGLADHSP